MRVMVVDPDESFAQEVAEQLTQSNFEVVCAASPDQMRAHLRTRAFQAILIDLSLRRMNGFDVARELRMETPASSLAILLMSPRHRPDAPEIESLKKDTESRFFFQKPIDFSALIHALRQPLPAASPTVSDAHPAPKSEANVPTSESNIAAKSADIPPSPKPAGSPKRVREIDWDNLRDLIDVWVEKQTGILVLAGQKSGTASIVEGGVLDERDAKIIKRCITNGTMAFKAQPVDGSGDWSRMGRLLFKGARLGTDPRKLRRYMSAVPTANDHTALARSLPISKDSRTFVGRINGTLTVAEILDAGGIPLSEVSRDITALVQMGMLSFQRENATPRAPEPAPNSGVGGLDRARVREANSTESEEQLLQRLEKEFLTIRDALPPVVLGIPADAERKLVDSAGARMRQRYAEIIARKGVSAEVRNIALEIAKKVDAAHRNFNFDGEHRTGSGGQARISVHDEVDEMLQRGRALIDAKDWVAADNLLSKAHEKRIDHVAVLANLGWARLHNPEADLEQRTEEGKDFLLLAEQFDPTDSDGQYYMAQVLYASNRLAAAEQRAERATKAAPEDTARAALLRKIRVLRAQQEAAT